VERINHLNAQMLVEQIRAQDFSVNFGPTVEQPTPPSPSEQAYRAAVRATREQTNG
jgi:hypothetical protein